MGSQSDDNNLGNTGRRKSSALFATAESLTRKRNGGQCVQSNYPKNLGEPKSFLGTPWGGEEKELWRNLSGLREKKKEELFKPWVAVKWQKTS